MTVTGNNWVSVKDSCGLKKFVIEFGPDAMCEFRFSCSPMWSSLVTSGTPDELIAYELSCVAGVSCSVTRVDADRLEVEFDEPIRSMLVGWPERGDEDGLGEVYVDWKGEHE